MANENGQDSGNRPVGRPSKYTDELGMTICEAIVSGKAIRQVCDEVEIGVTTLFRWLDENEEFRQRYARSKDLQAELMADEIKSIADENPVCEVPTKSGDVFTSTDRGGVERNRLRVDSRKWIASKLLPKRYGDKLAVEHDVSNELADKMIEAQKRLDAGS